MRRARVRVGLLIHCRLQEALRARLREFSAVIRTLCRAGISTEATSALNLFGPLPKQNVLGPRVDLVDDSGLTPLMYDAACAVCSRCAL